MIFKIEKYLLLGIFIVILHNAEGKNIDLIKNGKTLYSIVRAKDAPKYERKAAKDLQLYLKKISGVKLPIVSQSKNNKEIIIGKSAEHELTATELASTGKDGFLIKKLNEKIIIAGSTPKGTLHGVYTFLETYLGCRWYTSKAEKIPERKEIILDIKNEFQKPVLLFRDAGHGDAYNEIFAKKLKLTNHKATPSKTQLYENGRICTAKKGEFGLWVHSALGLVPPYKYFKTHPEYYALRDKKRQATQLCFSNPEIYDIVVKELKKRMAKNKDDLFWDVSQSDNGKYCQCAKCASIDKREGTKMGSILQFINKVAKVFPDKIITTLAYQYSRKPPRHIKPASNVGILLCYFTDKRDYLPLRESDREDTINFRKSLTAWSKICDKIIVYDYLVSDTHFLAPEATLFTMGPNFKFYVENGCIGIYASANLNRGGAFWEIRNYLAAKLLWNPQTDPQKIIDEFLNGYYGAAAPYMRKYINIMHKSLAQSKLFLSIFGRPSEYTNSYLSTAMLNKYNKLFDQAEIAVKGQKKLLARVQEGRLPLMYVQLLLKWGSVKQRIAIAKKFFKIANASKFVILGARRSIPWFKDLIMGKLEREQEFLKNKIGESTGNGNVFEIEFKTPVPLNETILRLDYINNFKQKQCEYKVEGFNGKKWESIYRSICSFVSKEQNIKIVSLNNILSFNYDDSNWSTIKFPDKKWRNFPNHWRKFTEQEKHKDMSSAPGWFRKKVTLPADWDKQDIILELGKDGVFIDDDVLVNVYWNGYLLNTCWSENVKKGWYRAAPVLVDKPEYGWTRPRHYYIKSEMLSKSGRNQLVVWTSFSKGPHGLIEGSIKLYNKKKQIDLKGKWKMRPASELSFKEKISRLRISFNTKRKAAIKGNFSAYKLVRKVIVCGVLLNAATINAGNYQESWNKGIEEYKAKDYQTAVKSFALATKQATRPADKYISMFYIGRCMEKMRNYAGARKVYQKVQQVPGIRKEQKSNAFIQYILNIYWGRKYKEVITVADNTLKDKGASAKIKVKACELGYLAARNLRLHQKSIEFAKDLAEYDKNPAGNWNARSLIFQALSLRLMKKYDDALAMLPEEKIQKMNPDRQGDAYIAIGAIYDSMQKYDKAVVAYSKAAEAAKHKGIIKRATIKKNNSLKKVNK